MPHAGERVPPLAWTQRSAPLVRTSPSNMNSWPATGSITSRLSRRCTFPKVKKVSDLTVRFPPRPDVQGAEGLQVSTAPGADIDARTDIGPSRLFLYPTTVAAVGRKSALC